MSVAGSSLNPNGNPAGNPVLWIPETTNAAQPLEEVVAALLSVPKSEADAEEARRPKRTSRKR
jgi:hypothetical protein